MMYQSHLILSTSTAATVLEYSCGILTIPLLLYSFPPRPSDPTLHSS